MGDSTAPMTIVELTDLECPYCRAFQASLDSLLDARPGAIRLVYVPFPLPIHRFADQAAKAAECAADAGGLRGWIKTVYANQDSLGLKTWSSIAQAAGLSHPELIERCAKAAGSNERLLAAHEFGRKLGLKGTPLIMANGWKYSFPPTRRILDSLVKEAIGEKAK